MAVNEYPRCLDTDLVFQTKHLVTNATTAALPPALFATTAIVAAVALRLPVPVTGMFGHSFEVALDIGANFYCQCSQG